MAEFAARPRVLEHVEAERRRVLQAHAAYTPARVTHEKIQRISTAPMRVIRVGNGPDIFMAGDFHDYLHHLHASGVFAAQKHPLEKVRALPITERPFDIGKPTVGIMLSEPMQLLPGDHETLQLHVQRAEAWNHRPVLIPPLLGAHAHEIVGAIDMYNGPGGADVDPAIYGRTNTYSLDLKPTRDAHEAAIVKAALDGDCYGAYTCRSFQLSAAVSGGSLHQDVREDGRSRVSRNQLDYGISLDKPFVLSRHGRTQFENRVVFAEGSEAHLATGKRSVVTNALHHQAVENPGAFANAGVVHDPDTGKATIEASERWNGMGFQFHTELMPNDKDSHALYAVGARRAEIFRMRREMRTDKGVDLDALRRRMQDRGIFKPEDFAWLQKNKARLAR